MRSKYALWAVAGILATLCVLVIVAAVGSRTETLRKLVIRTLEDRLESDVEMRSFSVDTVPQVIIQGEGLVLRLRGTDASTLQPLIQIDRFTVHCGLLDLLRRPRRFKHIELEGLVVTIPPGGLPDAQGPNGNPVVDAGSGGESPIVVEELRANGALLRITPRRADKQPREFTIHALTMKSLGRGERMPFEATLTNPLPKGLIETSGTFGPWRKGVPGATALAGRYSFAKADLGTIKGIGGTLDSTGEFAGVLERIVVKGETRTPDFRLDISGQPVPLDTTFETVVDGTNGDTYLNTVNVQLLHTWLTAKGAVAGTQGVKGRTIKLNVQVHKGRIEDLLRLSVKAKRPLMVGGVALHTDFTLPPGKADVIDRLQLDGAFDVAAAEFTDPKVREKLVDMSRRARGLVPGTENQDKVVSDMRGRFRLARSVLRLSDLSFSIPGATVVLDGQYGLRSEELAFDGTLRMQATVSQAAGGGLKSVFLKLVDPIFRKKGAGAVLPIRIRGTVDNPRFGLDVGRVFK